MSSQLFITSTIILLSFPLQKKAETTFRTLYVNSPVDGIDNVFTYVHSCEKHTNMTAKEPANTALEYSTTVRFIITYRYTVYRQCTEYRTVHTTL